MERMTGEETAPRGYGDGAAGEFAAAVVLWSSAAWTEAGESGWGLRRHRRYPCSMIQDWKLTLVVAASPYVGYRVEDEEIVTQNSAAWPGWFGVCSQRMLSLKQ